MTQSRNALMALSVIAAARAQRISECSAETYAEALIEPAQKAAHLNAFISFDPDTARAAARRGGRCP